MRGKGEERERGGIRIKSPDRNTLIEERMHTWHGKLGGAVNVRDGHKEPDPQPSSFIATCVNEFISKRRMKGSPVHVIAGVLGLGHPLIPTVKPPHIVNEQTAKLRIAEFVPEAENRGHMNAARLFDWEEVGCIEGIDVRIVPCRER